MTSPQTFFLGGYFLVEASPVQDWMERATLPEELISTSQCISKLHPDIIAIPWVNSLEEQRTAYRQNLNLTPKGFERFRTQTEIWHSDKRILWPWIFNEREEAREFYHAHLSNGPEMKLLGIATSGEFQEEMNQRARNLSDKEREIGCIENSILDLLILGTEVPVSEGLMGYDVLGLNFAELHSFICNEFVREFYDVLNIKLNSHGLIDDYAAAKEAAEFVQKPETGAEEGIWMPWAVVNYPLNY